MKEYSGPDRVTGGSNISPAPPQESQPGLSTVYLLIWLAAIFVWRILLTYQANLLPDECSYWAWSRRLDWSYFDNSGMVAYLIRLSTTIFGESTPLSVRFPFLVLSGIGTFLLYRVALILYGDRCRALTAAVALNLTPVAFLGGSAAVHDNALMFFWITTLWAASRFLRSQNPGWFYVMGASCGLAILSKYTGVLAAASLLIFFLWSPPHRKWLLSKQCWHGVAIAGVFTLPILWWNFRHEWASIYHILFIGTGSVSTARRLLEGMGYHLAQFLVVSPLFYLAILVSLASSLIRNVVKPKPEDALLLSFSAPLVLFGVLAFLGHVEANWASMGYASAAILAVELLAGSSTNRAGVPWKWFGRGFLKWSVILAIGPVILVVIHSWVGLLPAFLEQKLGKDDRVIWETRGWDGLGKHVAKLADEGDVIAADSYQLCALLEFNTPGQPKVRYLAPWKRPTQFDVWEPSFDNLKGSSILFVSPRSLEPSSPVIKTIYENFSRVQPLPPYDILYHAKPIRQLYLYRGHDFDPFSPQRLGPRSLFYGD